MKSLLLLLIVAGVSCSTPEHYGMSSPPPQKEGMARVVFKRERSVSGRAIGAVIIDIGTGLNQDAVLSEHEPIPPGIAFVSKRSNFKNLYLKLDDTDSYLLLGTISAKDERVRGNANFPATTVIGGRPGEMPISVAHFLQEIRSYYLNSKSLTPNATIVAVRVSSGQTLYWDRPPGMMRLEVIGRDNQQVVSEQFQVQGGKTYMVNYNFAGSRIAVTEKH